MFACKRHFWAQLLPPPSLSSCFPPDPHPWVQMGFSLFRRGGEGRGDNPPTAPGPCPQEGLGSALPLWEQSGLMSELGKPRCWPAQALL